MGCKWIFTIKTNSDGNTRYKARLVAKDFSQKEGIDYFETYAPVVRYESIRILLAVAAEKNYGIAQFDVKTAFLYGELNEEIFIEQLHGFVNKNQPKAVCKLIKSLYDLKQASRCWNEKFLNFLKVFDFQATESDICVFKGNVHTATVYLLFYVDDGLLMSDSKSAIDRILEELRKTFKITMNDDSYFVSLELKRDKAQRTIKITQSDYITRILEKFKMEDAHPIDIPAEPGLHLSTLKDSYVKGIRQIPYREAVGSLLFAARVSR